jgi:hypothetical protein
MVIFACVYEVILNPEMRTIKDEDLYQVEGETNGKENI